MIPELGNFALVLAFFLAMLLSIVPLVGSYSGNVLWMRSGRSITAGMFFFILVSFICLCYAFLTDDFSVAYVVSNSNSLLPAEYKLSAVWGGHEGSLLLWVLILAGWTLSVALFSRAMPLDMVARVLSVMGMVAVGFCSFVLITSNPFDRTFPNVPMDGGDLNPLLQDVGLIIHPPMLYMGYVGFSVVFAFAIAALLSGRLDSAWARWSRPWTTVAWVFLTLGIALGSWWAYYELGWGGWWFWDPVENASFMPWLAGTALIHSLAVTEKRGVFKSWTLLLAIFAFSLSLLGTFLVRSGVLTSVHAFAADPERGVYILGFLGVVVGGSLTLYALRAPVVKSVVKFEWLSRDAFLLVNNVLLIVALFTILLGTLYPLIADALNWGKISVGAPYFNFFFVPLMAILSIFLGIGAHLNWKKTSFKKVTQAINIPIVLAVVCAVALPFFLGKDGFEWGAAMTIALGSWVIFSTASDWLNKTQHATTRIAGIKKLRANYYGMVFGHLGFAICLLGVGLNTTYKEQRDLRMAPQQQIEQGGYTYQFIGADKIQGPNYVADRGTVLLFENGKQINKLQPEKRQYLSGGNVMTEAAIDASFTRDLYVALGESLNDGAWALRVHYEPFVRWIWLGALIMSLGGFLAVIDKRYRPKLINNAAVS